MSNAASRLAGKAHRGTNVWLDRGGSVAPTTSAPDGVRRSGTARCRAAPKVQGFQQARRPRRLRPPSDEIHPGGVETLGPRLGRR